MNLHWVKLKLQILKKILRRMASLQGFIGYKNADIVTQRFFDSLSSLVDSYCSDPELIDEDDLNDDELLTEVSYLKIFWENAMLA